jgi:hypothetical protein
MMNVAVEKKGRKTKSKLFLLNTSQGFLELPSGDDEWLPLAISFGDTEANMVL